MNVSHLIRRSFVLVALLAVASGPGCGSSGSVGDLPPEKPATQEDVQKSLDQIKQNMGGMKKR